GFEFLIKNVESGKVLIEKSLGSGVVILGNDVIVSLSAEDTRDKPGKYAAEYVIYYNGGEWPSLDLNFNILTRL
ncbi:MAG: hypothetical protein ACRDBG_03340, partial [Waterburya sp.]